MHEPHIDEPQSPPAPPVIPVGIATKVGYALGLVASLASALVLALEGLPSDASEATVLVTLIAAAAASIIRVNDGRMKQAATAIAAQPQTVTQAEFVAFDPDLDDPELDDDEDEPEIPDADLEGAEREPLESHRNLGDD